MRKPKLPDVMFFLSCLFLAIAIHLYVEKEDTTSIIINLFLSITASYGAILIGEKHE